MSYSNDHFFYKVMSFLGNGFLGSHYRLRTLSYTFTGFHRWKHMYNQKYRVFHLRGGIYPCLLLLDTSFLYHFIQPCDSVGLHPTYRAHPSNHQVWCLTTIMHSHPCNAMSSCICNAMCHCMSFSCPICN